MAFIKADPWDKMVQSNEGGVAERRSQKRTVASRDAERVTLGEGKRTPRT